MSEFHTMPRTLIAFKLTVWLYAIAIRVLLVKLCLQNSPARSAGKQCETTRTPFCVRNALVSHMLNVSKCQEVFFHYYLSNPEIDWTCSLYSLPLLRAEDFMDAPGPCISDTAPSMVNGNEISMNRTRTRYLVHG